MHGSGRGRAVGERARGRAGSERAGERAMGCLLSLALSDLGRRAARSPPLASAALRCPAHLLVPACLRPSRALLVSASPDRGPLAHPVLQQQQQQPLMIHPTPPPLARSLAGWLVPPFMHAPPCQSPAAPARPATAAPHVCQPCACNPGR